MSALLKPCSTKMPATVMKISASATRPKSPGVNRRPRTSTESRVASRVPQRSTTIHPTDRAAVRPSDSGARAFIVPLTSAALSSEWLMVRSRSGAPTVECGHIAAARRFARRCAMTVEVQCRVPDHFPVEHREVDVLMLLGGCSVAHRVLQVLGPERALIEIEPSSADVRLELWQRAEVGREHASIQREREHDAARVEDVRERDDDFVGRTQVQRDILVRNKLQMQMNARIARGQGTNVFRAHSANGTPRD